MTTRALELVRDAIRSALGRSRVAAADAYYKESRHRRWIRSGGSSHVSGARERGFAVRLFRGDGRVGHAFASGPGDDGGLDAVLDAAGAIADRSAPGAAFPAGPWDPPDLDLFDPAVDHDAALEGLLTRVERAVAEEGRGEVEVESLLAVAGTSRIALATSAGFAADYPASLVTVAVSLRARRGGEAAFHRAVLAARHLGSLDADRLGRQAARRARLPLDGGTVPPGPLRVALEPRAACVLVEQLLPSLKVGGRSSLSSSGERVGSAALTLVDDPSLRRGIGSAPFDGEGRPTAAHRLMEGGVLGPLLGTDLGEGRRVGAALRPSFADFPCLGASNLHVARGKRSPANLIAEAGSVLRVSGASLLGTGGAGSGEIVLAATGERVEAGEPAGGVRQVTLVGVMDDLLAGILSVGNDLAFHLRGPVLGSPTLLVDGMWVP